LPVDGIASASFIARLVFRIADFLPAALRAQMRVLNWTEVMAGMLRMLYASEVLDALVGPPAPEGTARWKLQTAVNIDINTRDEAWYDNLIDSIAQHRSEPRERVQTRASTVLARCEAIRYIQLGNPEKILIDDGSIRAGVLEQYGAGMAGFRRPS
jgi:hypothetical protein